MGTPKSNEHVQGFAGLFVLSLINVAVFEYVAICIQDGIGTDWICVGLVCWGVLIACSEKYVRWVVRKVAARFDLDA